MECWQVFFGWPVQDPLAFFVVGPLMNWLWENFSLPFIPEGFLPVLARDSTSLLTR